jgi:hypothetical protein
MSWEWKLHVQRELLLNSTPNYWMGCLLPGMLDHIEHSIRPKAEVLVRPYVPRSMGRLDAAQWHIVFSFSFLFCLFYFPFAFSSQLLKKVQIQIYLLKNVRNYNLFRCENFQIVNNKKIKREQKIKITMKEK